MSQRRWGNTRCRKFLARNQVSEMKKVGALTERQRRMLAEQLGSPVAPGATAAGPASRPLALVGA